MQSPREFCEYVDRMALYIQIGYDSLYKENVHKAALKQIIVIQNVQGTFLPQFWSNFGKNLLLQLQSYLRMQLIHNVKNKLTYTLKISHRGDKNTYLIFFWSVVEVKLANNKIHFTHVRCYISCVICNLSPVTCHLSPVTCHMSHVTCHLSHVTCHLSHVTCHMSKYIYIYFFFLNYDKKYPLKKLDKVVELVCGGYIINGAYPF